MSKKDDYDNAYDDMELGPNMLAFLPLLTTATELTKLVIANRLRNHAKIADEHIYEIYEESFSRLMDLPSACLDED